MCLTAFTVHSDGMLDVGTVPFTFWPVTFQSFSFSNEQMEHGHTLSPSIVDVYSSRLSTSEYVEREELHSISEMFLQIEEPEEQTWGPLSVSLLHPPAPVGLATHCPSTVVVFGIWHNSYLIMPIILFVRLCDGFDVSPIICKTLSVTMCFVFVELHVSLWLCSPPSVSSCHVVSLYCRCGNDHLWCHWLDPKCFKYLPQGVKCVKRQWLLVQLYLPEAIVFINLCEYPLPSKLAQH